MTRCVRSLADEETTEPLSLQAEPCARGWFFIVFDKVHAKQLMRIVVTMWAIWKHRRKTIQENIFQSPRRAGLAFAADLGIHTAVLASDFLIVIGTINDNRRSSYTVVTDEIKAWAQDFDDISYSHESRRSNQDTHILGRSSLPLSAGRHIWVINRAKGAVIPFLIDQ